MHMETYSDWEKQWTLVFKKLLIWKQDFYVFLKKAVSLSTKSISS